MILFTSDLHLNHDKEFSYKPRGFETVQEMNKTIINHLEYIVDSEDDLYILGDLMLGGEDKFDSGLELLSRIPGHIHLVRGNHDTSKRWEAFKTLPNVVERENAIYLNYNGYHFYLSHYPTFTANLEKETLKQCMINMYGHTHQKTNFYNEIPFMYHVGIDSHNNIPVSIDKAIEHMYKKIKECYNEL